MHKNSHPLRWLTFALLSLGLLGGCYDLSRPRLEDYAWLPAAPTAHAAGLRVTHFGTTTLLFDDGETKLMIDSFFTRPKDWNQLFFGKISSDRPLIHSYLAQAGVDKLAAILVFHSHYDHAMDIGPVAQETGADVLGSASTANIARGADLPEKRIVTVVPGKVYSYGKFRVTFLLSKHTGLPSLIQATGIMGDITEPLRQPASVYDYREGETYTIRIAHPLGTSLLKGGALVPGELRGYRAEAVFMCLPGLNQMSQEQQDQYFREVVLDTGVKRIIPVHWDDFSTPLAPRLTPMPKSAEDLDTDLAFLRRELAQHPTISLSFIPALTPVQLFGPGKNP